MVSESRQFAYLKSVIDTQRFAELGDVWSRWMPSPGLAVRCEISFHIETDLHSLAVLLYQLWA